MDFHFLSALVFLLLGCGFVAVNLLIGWLLRPSRPGDAKGTIYECGEPIFGDAWLRFDIRFYIVALVFVIFDVEVLFLFPWAVVAKSIGLRALWEAGVFLLILALGLAYVWKKGDLDWYRPPVRRAELGAGDPGAEPPA